MSACKSPAESAATQSKQRAPPVCSHIHAHTLLLFTRRKKEAREVHRRSKFAQKVHGLRAKLFNQKRFKEKVQMKKT